MESSTTNNFNSIRIKVASPEEILSWSYGEVLNPETINYRTQNFEKDGLFAENIFGPAKDFQCACGKYKHKRYKGIVCEKCGVEVASARVRRERMGHINLVAPVAHIWFWRKLPSRIGLLLGKSSNELEKVIYFAAYIITFVDEKAKENAIKQARKNNEDEVLINKLANLQKLQIISELDYRDLAFKFGHVFKAGIGAEAIRQVLSEIDLQDLIKKFEQSPADKRSRQALALAKNLVKSNIKPEWFCLTVLPVIPPELRPMVELEGGRFASSDLNDLYRRIINRNNRLRRLIELGAPEIICRNEKRMLQEAVDALIDNSARQKQTQVASSTGQKRALRSLADMLKGKKGRFRRNLLGKRVDYSGRSVIVSGPYLKMHQCGLPKEMALELFRPFVIHKILEKGLAHNVRAASSLIDDAGDEIYDLLEQVIAGRYILLNRAPTLHRLGVQAFQPLLIEGKAIQLHPLVCAAFNADFDGDQMAVHLPLTDDAQKEAREIIAAQKNALSPANGEPIANPKQDMVLGIYYMTSVIGEPEPEQIHINKVFLSHKEAILAYESRIIGLHTWIEIRDKDNIMRTTVGRILFNEALPKDIEFINEPVGKNKLKHIVGQIFDLYDSEKAVVYLDKIKDLGFHYATKSCLSWSMDDLQIPQNKKELVAKFTKRARDIEKYFEQGLLTDSERSQQLVSVWAELKTKVGEAVQSSLDKNGSVYYIVDSKSRGSWELVNQMSGMKGLVVDPTGQIIELPIRSSFKEGFGILEYFIASHGTRKGMADTALRTSSAGYLTRRLIDVAQDVIVREKDCGTKKSIVIYEEDCFEMGQTMSQRLFGRTAAETIKGVVKKGDMIDKKIALKIEKAIAEMVKSGQTGVGFKVYSPVTCESKLGVCQKCFGYDLGRNKPIELGQAVGVVAAQAIGEPGTQLTLRTFHSGGVAGGSDITQGLPRVEEIFEARDPKGKAVMAVYAGRVKRIREQKGEKVIVIQSSDKKASVKEYKIPHNYNILVEPGQDVKAGQQLCEGSLDLHELFNVAGILETSRYITKEIQKIYSNEGAMISDKYIEIIVRKMLSKSTKEGNELLGITRVSLNTDSWLSAASFQETSRILIQAAVRDKKDNLLGLKENVIVGRLIPAGTGFRK